MSRLQDKLRRILQAWLAGDFNGGYLYIALALFLISLFGLRDILVGPAVRRLLNIQSTSFLDPFFWIGIGLSVFTVWRYYSSRPLDLFPGAGRRDILIWLSLALPFLALTITNRLTLDFWLDEMMSIVRHIQPSLSSALTWYPIPNNHVFSNFIAGVYVQLIGRQDMQILLANPVPLRLLFLSTGIGTILVLAYTAQRYLGKQAAWLTVVLLCTTIPFFNFMVQVRGYSFTFFFASLLLLSILKYRERPLRKYALGIMVLACLIFYTIPSNLYFLLSLAIVALFDGKAYDPRTWSKLSRDAVTLKTGSFMLLNQGISTAVLIAAGLILSLVLYLPIIANVFDNRYVETLGFFRGTVFYDAFPRAMGYFFSGRGWLLILGWLGAVAAWFDARKKGDSGRAFLVQLVLLTAFLPYLLSFARGDNPFERTFLITLPAFVLSASLGIHQWLQLDITRSKLGKWHPLPYVLIGLIAYGTFFAVYRSISNEIFANLASENIKQVEIYDNTLWASHFLDHYAVLPVIVPAVQASADEPILIDLENTRFAFTIVEYLKAFGVEYVEIEDPARISARDAYVIVSYPNRGLGQFQEAIPGTACELRPGEISIYRSMDCRFPGRD